MARNEFFKEDKYPKAVKHDTDAINRNPSNPKVITLASLILAGFHVRSTISFPM